MADAMNNVSATEPSLCCSTKSCVIPVNINGYHLIASIDSGVTYSMIGHGVLLSKAFQEVSWVEKAKELKLNKLPNGTYARDRAYSAPVTLTELKVTYFTTLYDSPDIPPFSLVLSAHDLHKTVNFHIPCCLTFKNYDEPKRRRIRNFVRFTIDRHLGTYPGVRF